MPNYIFPCDINTVSQEFGGNPSSFQPDGHTGMDFAVPIGTPVVSPADGVVVFADWASVLGWPNPYYVAIDFDGPANGDQSAGIITIVDHGPGRPASIVAHLSDNNMVAAGQAVRQGQVIALSGMTGRSTGPHVHFDMLPDGWDVHARWYGRVNPRDYCSTGAPAPVQPQGDVVAGNQRITGAAGVTRRSEPNTGASVIDTFGGDLILTMGGYVYGQEVSIGGYTSSVWYKGGVSGGYMWIGGFTSQSLDGLDNLTPAPAPAKPNVRVTGPDGVNRRTIADKSGTLVDTFGPDLEITVGGFVRSTDPLGGGNNVWYVGGLSGGYMWSGGFTSQGTDGLTDLTPPAGVPVTPAPPVPVYDFVADFDFVEKIPANLTNVQRAADNPGVTVFPDKPEKIVVHQMGTPGVDTLGSTINEFKRPNSFKSTHFAVSGRHIVQMVSLKDRAYHAGAVGNNFVGIETDPLQDAATIESTRKLIKALNDRYGYEAVLVRHKDVPGNATSCGTLIDLPKYVVAVAPPVVVPTPTPVPVPVPVPTPTPTLDEAGVLRRFFEWLIQSFLSYQKKETK